jgi:hypothetical protein
MSHVISETTKEPEVNKSQKTEEKNPWEKFEM